MSKTTSRYVRPSEAMTTEQAAAWLGFATRTLVNWRRYKSGPVFVRVGGKIRYLEADLVAWVEQQNMPRAA